MDTKELIDVAKQIIGERMEMDYLGRLYGTVIFRQRIGNIREDEINQIRAALTANGIYSQLQKTPQEYLLRLLLEYSRVKRPDIRINILLFILTIISTTLAGAMLVSADPFASWSDFFKGFPYSVAIMSILFAHEMGHYLYALRYRIYATLPYFIPFYLPIFNFGTFGAFIKMKSPIPDKKALFDVSFAGPVAGLVMSIFFLIFGFSQLPGEVGVKAYIETIHPWSPNGENALTLGSSLLFDAFRTFFNAEYLPMWEVYHFPFIFGGWIGLLVTALNLMPIGQLDGGHISYALLGKKAKFVATAAFIALALLNFYSTNWLLWTILILLVIRLKHPPTMNDDIELDDTRRNLAWFSYIIFITCFSPMPIFIS